MTEPLIRDMEDADREAVIDLVWQLNLFENKISRDRAQSRKAAAGGLAANRRRMADHGGVELVAEIGGKVVGYLLCVIEKAEAYVRDNEGFHAYIAELVVAEGHRGHGLGQRLIKAAEDFARGHGMPSIQIGALAGNGPANRLYEHLGYGSYSISRKKRLA
jgi:ribosomal protein S18 acetylase RimI-like enzyme